MLDAPLVRDAVKGSRHGGQPPDRVLQREYALVTDPMAEHKRAEEGAAEPTGMSAGVGDSGQGVGALDQLGYGVHVTITGADEGEFRLQVLIEGKVQNNVYRVLADFLANLAQGHALVLTVLAGLAHPEVDLGQLPVLATLGVGFVSLPLHVGP